MIEKIIQAWGPNARLLFRATEFNPKQMSELAQRVPPALNTPTSPVDIFLRCDTMGTTFATIKTQNTESFLPALSVESALKKAALFLKKCYPASTEPSSVIKTGPTS